ncbi:MAG: DMT family transporter [Nitratireductor sp.]
MKNRSETLSAYVILAIAPLFFSTNVVFGRAAQDIEPFTLAALRWGLTALILLAFTQPHWPQMRVTFKQNLALVLLCGFLGMWICGGAVYWALKHTTATNGTLIYTVPPVIIVIVEYLWRGRPIVLRETAGILLAFAGVLAIVLKGDASAIFRLDFNPGDLVFVVAAISWALYSVLLKSRSLAHLTTLPLLAMVASAGALTLLPFAIGEVAITGNFPDTERQWWIIAGIVLLASIISFSTFQYGVKVLGPSIAGIFLYLLPPCGIGLAWFFLGESLLPFHFAGMAKILGGVIVATLPVSALRRSARPPA